MPKTRQQKEETVQKLTDKLSKAHSVVFVDYKGLSMAQLTELRNRLREVGAEFAVTKNTLLKRAVENLKLKVENSVFEGPVGTLFAYEDEISPIKFLTKALKDASLGQVKSGFLNQELIDDVIIERLASLPSKDELKAKIVGGLGAPLYGIVGVLQANLRNLVYALNQIKTAKEVNN